MHQIYNEMIELDGVIVPNAVKNCRNVYLYYENKKWILSTRNHKIAHFKNRENGIEWWKKFLELRDIAYKPAKSSKPKKRNKKKSKPNVKSAFPWVYDVTSSEVKNELCYVCCGDGGVNGGCYKCDGSGWISSKSKATYSPNRIASIHGDNSRISNANYLGNNQGAHYRDMDGRFGSNPEHDDYSDEGLA